MAEFLHLHAAQGLHHHNGVRVHGSNRLDERELVAREQEREAVGLFRCRILVGSHKHNSYIGIPCKGQGCLVNGGVLRGLVHQIDVLRAVVSQFEGAGFHGHAAAVHSAHAGAGGLRGFYPADEVAVRTAHADFHDTALGGNVEAHGDVLDVGDIHVVIGGPGAVVNGTDLFLVAHAGAHGNALGGR